MTKTEGVADTPKKTLRTIYDLRKVFRKILPMRVKGLKASHKKDPLAF
jgi:hypothetical protein